MIPALLFASLVAATNMSERIATVEDLQSDFETAIPCQPIDGKAVWKGGIAFYIGSYAFPSEDSADMDVVGADAVLPADNSAETITEFEYACRIDAAKAAQ